MATTRYSDEDLAQFKSRIQDKLQSAQEVISDNLKIAILLKALPQEFASFTAAVQLGDTEMIVIAGRTGSPVY